MHGAAGGEAGGCQNTNTKFEFFQVGSGPRPRGPAALTTVFATDGQNKNFLCLSQGGHGQCRSFSTLSLRTQHDGARASTDHEL